jgi:hypothetical protein
MPDVRKRRIADAFSDLTVTPVLLTNPRRILVFREN